MYRNEMEILMQGCVDSLLWPETFRMLDQATYTQSDISCLCYLFFNLLTQRFLWGSGRPVCELGFQIFRSMVLRANKKKVMNDGDKRLTDFDGWGEPDHQRRELGQEQGRRRVAPHLCEQEELEEYLWSKSFIIFINESTPKSILLAKRLHEIRTPGQKKPGCRRHPTSLQWILIYTTYYIQYDLI